MRGVEHVRISLFSAGVLLAPQAPTLGVQLTLVSLLGAFIGALAPDADAEDAAIFHSRINGVSGIRGLIINTAAIVLPIFGYTIRYLIYYPLSLVFLAVFGKRYRHQHRGLLHSITGICLTTGILLAYIWVLFAYVGWQPLPVLPAFGIAFFCGCFFHLMEDTCTPSGVAWLYPFSRVRACGTIRTSSRFDIRPGAFTVLLALTVAATIAAVLLEAVRPDHLVLASAAGLVLLWLLFLAAARVRYGGEREDA